MMFSYMAMPGIPEDERIKIESGIPPPRNYNKGRAFRAYKYPLDRLKIGDSFYIPDVPKSFSIYSIVINFNRKTDNNIQVTQRREDNGVRVWRIK